MEGVVEKKEEARPSRTGKQDTLKEIFPDTSEEELAQALDASDTLE